MRTMGQPRGGEVSSLDGTAPSGASVGPLSAGPSRHGEPVTLGNFGGFFHPGSGALGVLMLSAFGFEEVCLRSTWYQLATRLSAAGLPSLRFDYPGTGDALDPETAPEGIDDWKDAVRRAARHLVEISGCDRIALVGQGLGGALAMELAPELEGVQAVVLMAPVDNGRHYLRELMSWSRIVTDTIGIPRDPQDESGLSVAGLPLSPERAAAIKAIQLAKLERKPADEVLMLARPMTDRDEVLAVHLETLGAKVTRQPYDGYDKLLTDPTQAEPPVPTLDRIVEWLAGHSTRGHGLPTRRPSAEPLRGDGFEELPARFGPDERLFGVFCRPTNVDNPPAVIFANGGREYHIGWARMVVDMSRALAQAGFASLRFDTSAIGDSAGDPNSPGEVLYSSSQIDDIVAAIDHVEAMTGGEISLVGRCSGAYVALQGAIRDERVRGMVAINAQRFIWDPDEDVATAIRYGHRSVSDFGADLLKFRTLQRFLTGKLNVIRSGRYIAGQISGKIGRAVAPFLGALSKQNRLRRTVQRQFHALSARKTKSVLLFSVDDAGLAQFHIHFGKEGKRLARHSHASMQLIPDADHNFTHRAARERLLATLTEILRS